MKTFSPLLYSLKIQAAVCVLCVIPSFLISDIAAISFLLGTVTYIVPNMYFTYYAFRYTGSKWVVWINHSFLWGEMGKQSLVAIGFALIFNFVKSVDMKMLFSGFIIMIFIQFWLAKRIADTVAEVANKS